VEEAEVKFMSGDSNRPECFVIAPIGPDKSDIRTRSDQILKHVIRPVAEQCGYKAVRADEISEPGSITTQVINRILTAPMVVADLTGNNANVFYELAIRHAIHKPYVQVIQKGERIPFDVAGVRTIEIDHTNLDSVATAKEEMKKQMIFTASNLDKIESPIGAAVDFATLTQSDDPTKRQLAELLATMSEVKALVERISMPAVIPTREQISHFEEWTNAEAAVLRRENERLRSTRGPTQEQQLKEEIERLRQENEKAKKSERPRAR
jgi:hypothetical protein